jgi:hypothetical protein
MITPTWMKLAAIGIVLATLFIVGFHFGGMSSAEKLAKYQTDVEAQYAANLKTVADTLNKQIQDGVAERAAQQKVIDAYDLEKALPPVTAGVVERLRYIESASCTAGHQLPGAPAVAGGAQAASGVPGGVSELDRLHQAAFDAAARDASRLNAVVKLAP